MTLSCGSLMEVDISVLAALAHVDVSTKRREKLQEDILAILAYVETLQHLNVPAIGDERASLSVPNLREDELVACTPEERRGVVENFPHMSGDGLLEASAALARDL